MHDPTSRQRKELTPPNQEKKLVDTAEVVMDNLWWLFYKNICIIGICILAGVTLYTGGFLFFLGYLILTSHLLNMRTVSDGGDDGGVLFRSLVFCCMFIWHPWIALLFPILTCGLIRGHRSHREAIVNHH